ncbi:helix-turn-helix domain-containing protein [Deminuibacter soli]|uniref:AraC family transcriptional regulator n=1 Tax=Deminuibacter soli TaxID=2291815 RepID=A0A3E1NKI4_9BACT|nr:helix-turn-helix domain-containing protein [Deminuibacter soli]RFM28298.1 AraC family transcriptional regulator [Deminuibacter soli]
MEQPENIRDFYHRYPAAYPEDVPINNAQPGHFNVFARDSHAVKSAYRRRDFYKISYIIGTGRLHYADKWIAIDGPAIVLSNPFVAYSFEIAGEAPKGWFCLFSEAFLQPADRIGALQDSPLFNANSVPVFFPDERQHADIVFIFEKMMREMESAYEHKYQVLRNYLHLLMHETMKIQPATGFHKQINAASRITHLFFDLLERQFPISSADHVFNLKSPQDYAGCLSVHVNHLNRAVKESTGQTTTAHIASRIVQEANILLQHTEWSIAEIAYSLGFEYPAYFTTFYRKHTGQAPIARRQGIV